MEIRRIIKVLLRNQPILLGVRNQPKAWKNGYKIYIYIYIYISLKAEAYYLLLLRFYWATSMTNFSLFFSYFWLFFFLLILFFFFLLFFFLLIFYFNAIFPPTFPHHFYIFICPLLSSLNLNASLPLFIYSFYFGSFYTQTLIINLIFSIPFYIYFLIQKRL